MNKYKRFTHTLKFVSGFTLIELLTVVAIMGILSAIVFTSLTSARLKSKDSAVITQLSNMKVQAEIYYDLNNNYGGICEALASARGFGGSGPGLLKAVKDSTAIPSEIVTSSIGEYNKVTCNDSASAWAVEAPLSKSESGSSRMYCVDSKNSYKELTSNFGNSSDTSC
jgi:prepilin-type N-terminal cleavage/methylation domain-containing protein